jgi:hypothetical protein
MAHKPPKATLASSKGGSLLSELKKKMTPEEPVRSDTMAKGSAGRPEIEEELKAAFAHRGGPPSARRAPAPKVKREKSKEYIKIADPELRRAVLAEVRKIGASKSASSPTADCRNDLGERAFKRLAALRSGLDGFSASYNHGDGRPPTVDDAISRRISVGAQQVDDVVDADNGFFLGYDFGTSTTKAVARYPYGGIDDAFAIDVPSSVSNEPHLWPTTVWFERRSGRFSLTRSGDALCLDSFKEALIEGRGLRICAGSGVTMAQAAVGFLALHFAYCLGSAVEQHAKFKLAGVNIGVPVAALKATPTVKLFEQVVNAALFLIPFAPALTLDAVKSALEAAERSRVAAMLHTELAGAIAGYCAMPRPYVGGHMIIDCGSATLDMASFALDGLSLRPIAIYDARVEHLGADACTVYQQLGASMDECRGASRYQEHLVFARTLQFERARFAQSDGAFPYQVILVGGGIHSGVHEPLFKNMESAFHRGLYRPELAPGLRYNAACEAGRLILADGLARDPIDLRQVAMPGDPPVRPVPLPEVISKDQV